MPAETVDIGHPHLLNARLHTLPKTGCSCANHSFSKCQCIMLDAPGTRWDIRPRRIQQVKNVLSSAD